MSIGKDLGLSLQTKKHEPSDKLLLPTCLLGLEFEFEGVNDVRWIHRELGEMSNLELKGYWKAKQDNSLHDRGGEYVFDSPMYGSDAVDAVTLLCDHANQQQYLVSARTGLHVHVDARELSHEELKRLCVFYAVFEKAIYNYVGDHRAENPFCIPWYHAGGSREDVGHVLHSTDSEEFKGSLQALENRKYSGLNVESLCRFGSIEWRHATTLKDSAKVLEWVNICLRFKEAAKRIIDPVDHTLGMMSGMGVIPFARAVLKEQFNILNYPGLESDVWQYGVPTAQEILFKEIKGWDYPGTKGVNQAYRAWKEVKAKAPTKKEEPKEKLPGRGARRLEVGDNFFRPRARVWAEAPPPPPEPIPFEPFQEDEEL